jgi:hypothetical protein
LIVSGDQVGTNAHREVNMKVTLDLATYLQVYQMGSSIHGDLLKPNDIDIGISIKLPGTTSQWVKCFRIGKFNLVLLYGVDRDTYINGFDMDIVRGYKSIITRKLYLSEMAKGALKNKHIQQIDRDNDLFKINEEYSKEKVLERALKYYIKLPQGWTFNALNSRVQEELEEVSNG